MVGFLMGGIMRRTLLFALLLLGGSTVGVLLGRAQASNDHTPPWVRPDHTVDESKAPAWTIGGGDRPGTLLVDSATGQLACFPTGFKRPPPPLPPNAQAPQPEIQRVPVTGATPEVIHVRRKLLADTTPGVRSVPLSEIPTGASCTEDSSAPTVFLTDPEKGYRLTVPAGRGRALPSQEDR
jgi:hypothetical protein